MLIEYAQLYAPLQDLMSALPAEGVLAADVVEPGKAVAPEGVGEKVKTLLGWLLYFATAACVAGLIIAAGKMAIAHRQGDSANVSHLAWVLAACVVIGSASSIVQALI